MCFEHGRRYQSENFSVVKRSVCAYVHTCMYMTDVKVGHSRVIVHVYVCSIRMYVYVHTYIHVCSIRMYMYVSTHMYMYFSHVHAQVAKSFGFNFERHVHKPRQLWLQIAMEIRSYWSNCEICMVIHA
jgi:hypothetical protein